MLKAHLNIRCLSQQQQELLICEDRFVWLDGPAGSGKTIVTLGKIFQHALKNIGKERSRKVIIIPPSRYVSSETYNETYGRILNDIRPGMFDVVKLDVLYHIDIKKTAQWIKNLPNPVILIDIISVSVEKLLKSLTLLNLIN